MSGEVILKCEKHMLQASISYFTQIPLSFKIDMIYPADDPTVATLRGHGMTIRLDPQGKFYGQLRLVIKKEAFNFEAKIGSLLVAPNGTTIEIACESSSQELLKVDFKPNFVITKQNKDSKFNQGRAGMTYRDLIPGRLNGSYIASHITVPEGGPISDWVHYHVVHFQMIFCQKGWVRVVYEDQGDSFVLSEGDLVLQPPGIRHRVLECSKGLEVIEITSPAQHLTCADHELELPNLSFSTNRIFGGGQTFLRHIGNESIWEACSIKGFEFQRTKMKECSIVANVEIFRTSSYVNEVYNSTSHDKDLLFLYICCGKVNLLYDEEEKSPGGNVYELLQNESVVVPAGKHWSFSNCSLDLLWLSVLVAV